MKLVMSVKCIASNQNDILELYKQELLRELEQ